jgi:hypothetical protein
MIDGELYEDDLVYVKEMPLRTLEEKNETSTNIKLLRTAIRESRKARAAPNGTKQDKPKLKNGSGR